MGKRTKGWVLGPGAAQLGLRGAIGCGQHSRREPGQNQEDLVSGTQVLGIPLADPGVGTPTLGCCVNPSTPDTSKGLWSPVQTLPCPHSEAQRRNWPVHVSVVGACQGVSLAHQVDATEHPFSSLGAVHLTLWFPAVGTLPPGDPGQLTLGGDILSSHGQGELLAAWGWRPGVLLTSYRAAPHNKEFSGSKYQQCRG